MTVKIRLHQWKLDMLAINSKIITENTKLLNPETCKNMLYTIMLIYLF